MKKFLLILGLMALAVPTLMAESPTIYGFFGKTSSKKGVHKFQAETPATFESIYPFSSYYVSEGGGVFTDNQFIFVEKTYSSNTLKVIKYLDIDNPSTYSLGDEVTNLPVTSTHTALCQDPSSGQIYGIFYNESGSANKYFFGTLNPTTGLSTKIQDVAFTSFPTAIAINKDGDVYVITKADGILHKGTKAGNFTEVGELSEKPYPSGSEYTMAMTFDPNDGTLYWSRYNPGFGYDFCTINPATCEVTILGDHGSTYMMACALYIAKNPTEADPKELSDFSVTADGFNTTLTVSFTVPSQTVGGANLTGDLKTYVVIDGEFVDNGAKMAPGAKYTKDFNVSDGKHNIMAWVTTSDAEPLASKKSSMEYFAGQDIPEAVSELTATKGENDNITITWTAPTIGITGGNFNVEALRYKINICPNSNGEEGEEVATGLNTCTYTFVPPTTDLRFLQFEVIPYTDAVTGNSAKTEQLVVGEDFPGMVGEITGNQTETSIELSWSAPEEGKNGSWYDAESLTYTVKLLPNTTLEEGLTTTAFTYPVEGDELRNLQFEIIAVTDKGEGPGKKSGKFTIGAALTVPFIQTFEGLDGDVDNSFFTIINANEDNKTWDLYESGYGDNVNHTLRITYSSSGVQQDDWAITAPILLRAGHEYKLSYDALLAYPSWGIEYLELYLGTANTVEGMTTPLREEPTGYEEKTQVDEETFSIDTTGVYYIGFHIVTPGNSGNLELDNIALDFAGEHSAPAAVPAAAESVTVTATANDDDSPVPTTATVTFTVPDKDAEGNADPEIDLVNVYRGDKLVYSAKYPVENEEISIEDTIEEEGYYTYTVEFVNAVGASEKTASEELRVGMKEVIDFVAAPTAGDITYESAVISFSYQIANAPEGATARAIISCNGLDDVEKDLAITTEETNVSIDLTDLAADTDYEFSVILQLLLPDQKLTLAESEAKTVSLTTATAPAVKITQVNTDNITDSSVDIIVEFDATDMPDNAVISVEATEGDDTFTADEIEDASGKKVATVHIDNLDEGSDHTFVIKVKATKGLDGDTLATDEYEISFRTTAVGLLESESGDIRYFDINGVEVKYPEQGIYIILKDGKTSKVVIRK